MSAPRHQTAAPRVGGGVGMGMGMPSVPRTGPLAVGSVCLCVSLGLGVAAIAVKEWIHVESKVNAGADIKLGLWTACYVPLSSGEEVCLSVGRTPWLHWLQGSRVFSILSCINVGIAGLSLGFLAGCRVAKRACGCDAEARVAKRAAWTCLFGGVAGCTAMSLMRAHGGPRVGLALEAASWSLAVLAFGFIYVAYGQETPCDVVRAWRSARRESQGRQDQRVSTPLR